MNATVFPFPPAPQPAPAPSPISAGPVPAGRVPLAGGTFDPGPALDLMNSWFFVSEHDGEVGIYRIEDDGTLTYLAMDDFKLLLANIFVDVSSQNQQSSRKLVAIDKFWLRHPYRRSCSKIVFEPSGQVGVDEYNLYRGLAVIPAAGFQKQRRLLRHIFRIICGRDKIKFKYLMKWLAWSVQNPHRHAEVMVVLMSNTEGSGKTTLGQVMLIIFGRRHGLLVDNKEQLLGNFNSHLETTCFVLGEEVLWAGDPRTADALKSRVTASTIPIDEKYRHRRQVPNRLHVMLTTNHPWAISAGVQARRYFVVEVSDEVAQDKSWFDPLYRDLEAGGIAEFLNLLLSLKLGNWHPREVPKTAELVEQQVLSAGSVEEWLLACADLESIVNADPYSGNTPLACDYATRTLYDAYCNYTRRRAGARVQPLVAFGKVLTKVLGPSRRLAPAPRPPGAPPPPPGAPPPSRPPGYHVPDAPALHHAVHKHLRTGK
jgi:Family of unknown function (DUF5906)